MHLSLLLSMMRVHRCLRCLCGRAQRSIPRSPVINRSFRKLPEGKRNVVFKNIVIAHLVELAIHRAVVTALSDVSDAAIAVGIDRGGIATAE